MHQRTHRHGIPLPDATRDRLRALVELRGEYVAADLIGCGYPTIVRALAGLGVRRASATAIEARLAALAVPTEATP